MVECMLPSHLLMQWISSACCPKSCCEFFNCTTVLGGLLIVLSLLWTYVPASPRKYFQTSIASKIAPAHYLSCSLGSILVAFVFLRRALDAETREP